MIECLSRRPPSPGRAPQAPEIRPDIENANNGEKDKKEWLKSDKYRRHPPEPASDLTFLHIVYQNGNPLSRIKRSDNHEEIGSKDADRQ